MKYRMMILSICGLFFFFLSAQGQFRHNHKGQSDKISLTGSLHYDLTIAANQEREPDSTGKKSTVVFRKRYSPLRAALFSAVVPGAGQLYTKSYWQSAAFFGTEVLAWVLYVAYEKKGDDQTDAFQKYADEHWSVIRYVDWICGLYLTNRSTIIPGGESASIQEPWKYVDWEQLNFKEDTINGIAGSGFTHKLEQHGEQQYYEMIGKYPQFGGGWDDASTYKPGGFTDTDMKSLNPNVSPRFREYSQMRGDANKFYNIATTVTYVIIANHIFSALEAAWNASKINHKIKLQGHIQSRTIYGNMVEFVPTLHVNYEL